MKENFYLSFPKLPGEPYIALDTNFTIGAEVGDYILKKRGISPRHCTFEIRKGVVTITDHNTEIGTYIDDQRIDPGKMFILMPGDRVRLGQEVTAELIHTDHLQKTPHLNHWDTPPEVMPPSVEEVVKDRFEKTEIFSLDELDSFENENDAQEEFSPPIPLAKRSIAPVQETEPLELEDNIESEEQFIDDFDEEIDNIEIKLDEHPRKIQVAPSIAGALSRLFAFIIDCLFAVSIYNLLNPYTSFEKVLSFLRVNVIASLLSKTGFIDKIISEFSFLIDFSSFLILFLVVSHLCFGLSLGQASIGIKVSDDNWWQKRLKAFARSIIGIITLPFLVFDIPALFPKRTFKEKMTSSALLFKNSGIKFFRGLTVFYLALFWAFISPLFQGFQLQPVYTIAAKADGAPSSRNVIERFKEITLSSLSASLVNKNEFIVIPYSEDIDEPNFLVHPLKDTNTNEIINKGSSVIEVVAQKDIIRLLSKASAGNPMFSKSFPVLQDFIKRAQLDSAMFRKKNLTSVQKARFNDELYKLTRTSLDLGLKGLLDHVQIHGPFIKGFLDFKVGLLADVGEIDEIKSRYIGNSEALILSKKNIGELDVVIPIFAAEKISIMKVQPTHLANSKIIFPYIYNDFFKGAIWGKLSQIAKSETDPLSGLDMFEYLSRYRNGFIKMSKEQAMRVYSYYFKTAQKIIENDRSKLIESLSHSIKMITGILKKSIQTVTDTDARDTTSKLIEDLISVKNQVTTMNKEFFGLETNAPVVEEEKEAN